MYGDDSDLRAVLERAPSPMIETKYIDGTKYCRYCEGVKPAIGAIVHGVTCWDLMRRRVLDGGSPDPDSAK